MIFWERVNPLLDVSFDGADDYWEWQEPPGWESLDGNSIDWSMPISGDAIYSFVKERLDTVEEGCAPYQDHLVIYGPTGANHWKVILLASSRAGLDQFGTAAPQWWMGPEDNPLRMLMGRVLSRMDIVKRLNEPRRWAYKGQPVAEVPLEVVEGYCSLCGIPNDRHVPHTVPGRQQLTSLTSEELKAYFGAFRDYYWPVLQTMTDEELFKMPMSTNLKYLKVLTFEIKRRLDIVPPVRDRLDRLMAEDLLEEG